MGADYVVDEIPADMLDEAAALPREADREGQRGRRQLLEKYLGGEEITEDEIKARAAQAHHRVGRDGRSAPSCPSSAARRSRTRACSRCSTRSSTTCRRRSTFRRSMGIDPRQEADRDARSSAGRRTRRRSAALAFKIMTDPFVGQLTFFRVYSGMLHVRLVGAQRDQGQDRAHRPPAEDARQQARGNQGSLRRRHRRRGRPEERDHRRHALRREEADRARVDGLPRAGHLARHRAEDQGRPGKARRRRWRS